VKPSYPLAQPWNREVFFAFYFFPQKSQPSPNQWELIKHICEGPKREVSALRTAQMCREWAIPYKTVKEQQGIALRMAENRGHRLPIRYTENSSEHGEFRP
jgi:poly(3-hydroxybutyrate) depolymerase